MLLYGAAFALEVDLWSLDWFGMSEETTLRSDNGIVIGAPQGQLQSCINFRPCIALS